MLEREEYVEQAYFFRTLHEQSGTTPIQELMFHVREELLATSNLPMAIDFMLAELKHSGRFGPAMEKLDHYFAPFQAYLICEAEDERGRFDVQGALQVLHSEAKFRAADPTPQGLFLFQFETLSRNRLRYDPGLKAVGQDPLFDDRWREWILTVRRQIGLVDIADMIFVRSQHYLTRQSARLGGQPVIEEAPVLFGEKEGKIALANRRKEPEFLFAALQRHLNYPTVPRPRRHDPTPELIPQLMRRLERLESRLKMMEEEQRDGAIDLEKYFPPPRPDDSQE
ncbi:MAG: hypothetical protein QF805_24745 [Pirellulaceae bacterium]|nr:hypothetical protein [Pirellulaceae bacterium]